MAPGWELPLQGQLSKLLPPSWTRHVSWQLRKTKLRVMNKMFQSDFREQPLWNTALKGRLNVRETCSKAPWDAGRFGAFQPRLLTAST